MNSPLSSSNHALITTAESLSSQTSCHEYVPSITENNGVSNPFQNFYNPFSIEDLAFFDDATLYRLLHDESLLLSIEKLASAVSGSSTALKQRIEHALSAQECSQFRLLEGRPMAEEQAQANRRQILDTLFWDMIYWKHPDLYDELTEGEQLHSGIFQSLLADIRGKVVLDAACGTGRATLECLRCGAGRVYAVDPSPAALALIGQKVAGLAAANRTVTLRGCFEELPLENGAVDTAISCSAFKASETGLKELLRVTKPGGKVVLIWPRDEDYTWLAEHGFCYVRFSTCGDACVHFRSFESALRCLSLFYAANSAARDYLLKTQEPDIPYALLGFKQPSDYCWRRV